MRFQLPKMAIFYGDLDLMPSLLDILAILGSADMLHDNSFLEASCAILSFHVGGLFLTMSIAP